ncbi:hypothetical protein CY34DRAFT_745445 [Suillus luteus UH-Slu-Lm8-n1]|uniref:Uncharacterized protein n=1 Tax=Suillus luteus UH-Slu-Lm8-n1 TaxID=930992 RepID=A0A0C9ZU94_9AGAM|nr:hypothetical protein CY34DRAFT_745445 [Suillus luteus UH-Slu-Lm8-n1]
MAQRVPAVVVLTVAMYDSCCDLYTFTTTQALYDFTSLEHALIKETSWFQIIGPSQPLAYNSLFLRCPWNRLDTESHMSDSDLFQLTSISIAASPHPLLKTTPCISWNPPLIFYSGSTFKFRLSSTFSSIA